MFNMQPFANHIFIQNNKIMFPKKKIWIYKLLLREVIVESIHKYFSMIIFQNPTYQNYLKIQYKSNVIIKVI